ncbi:hypothetical protein A6302_00506 [Methylobrevis pamukkalensis]|uniref:Uncharacterized protein n=2 Tax=Methylobrevis pamukkalensis TaxID=1439726 RepID=A0A1E3H707_9HYPH|nr:hypothetical protein A6302_00506 [Methylobrevis pamukkalensis]
MGCFKLLRGLGLLAFVVAMPLSAQAQTAEYDRAGPWKLFRTVEGGKVEACHAEMFTGTEQGLIFDHNPNYTSIGFMGIGSAVDGADSKVEIWFDEDRLAAEIIEMPLEGMWRVYRSSNDMPDGLHDLFANRSRVSFRYQVPGDGNETMSFPLKGTNAMMERTFACVQTAQAAAAPAQAAPVQPAPVQRAYDWVAFRPGMLGPRLVSAGTMPDGMPVYVCAAQYNGGFHPGMTGAWSERCSFGYGGMEVVGDDFFVLTGQGRWRALDGIEVPGNAVEGGQEADGRKLYICRVNQQGAMLAGKYRPGLGGCNIGDGGSEVTLGPVEILTF